MKTIILVLTLFLSFQSRAELNCALLLGSPTDAVYGVFNSADAVKTLTRSREYSGLGLFSRGISGYGKGTLALLRAIQRTGKSAEEILNQLSKTKKELGRQRDSELFTEKVAEVIDIFSALEGKRSIQEITKRLLELSELNIFTNPDPFKKGGGSIPSAKIVAASFSPGLNLKKTIEIIDSWIFGQSKSFNKLQAGGMASAAYASLVLEAVTFSKGRLSVEETTELVSDVNSNIKNREYVRDIVLASIDLNVKPAALFKNKEGVNPKEIPTLLAIMRLSNGKVETLSAAMKVLRQVQVNYDRHLSQTAVLFAVAKGIDPSDTARVISALYKEYSDKSKSLGARAIYEEIPDFLKYDKARDDLKASLQAMFDGILGNSSGEPN